MVRRLFLVAIVVLAGCKGAEGAKGADGEDGARGEVGARGTDGMPGAKGDQGPAGVDGADVALSGSRLKARWDVGADGSRAFAGWFDTQIGAECSYAMASDGKRRCLPEAPAGFLQFTDDKCTYGYLVLPDSTCSVPAHVKDAKQSACGETHVYKVGAAVPPPPPLVYQHSGGGACIQGTAGQPGTYYELGPAVDPGTFAESMAEQDP